MEAHFIDVGQGACALLEVPCRAIMIDTGGDKTHSDLLKKHLTEFFQRRTDLHNTLAALSISHPHIDHSLGIPIVAKVCKITNYIDDGIGEGSGRHVVQWIRDQVESGALSTKIREVSDDEITALPHKTGLTDDEIDPLKCDQCDPKIVVLSGSMPANPGWSAKDYGNWRNHSLVIGTRIFRFAKPSPH
jgi:competence protein ComEC